MLDPLKPSDIRTKLAIPSAAEAKLQILFRALHTRVRRPSPEEREGTVGTTSPVRPKERGNLEIVNF